MRRTRADRYLLQVNRLNDAREFFRRIWLHLSLIVIVFVFWGLKLTGITMAGEAFCGAAEHQHDDDCQVRILICQEAEVPAHVHDDQCSGRVLQCTQSEHPAHIHEDACWEKVLICQMEDQGSHTHSEECIEIQMLCPLEEGETHAHGEDCTQINYICGLEETQCHVHSDGCYQLGMETICGQEATEGHSHGDGCYIIEEGTEPCALEETQGHTHTEQCYEIQKECPIQEHIHIASCYSDISADLETSDIWEDSLMGLIRSPSTAENIVMVAQSQLGVSESLLNFQVDEFGVRRGVTRYGQWYGNLYGDWSAMFASFCLYYAGVEGLPENAGPNAMMLEWDQAQLYAPASEHSPVIGELVFLDKDENGAVDSVAIVTKLEENVIFAIEGNLNRQVVQIGDVKLYPEGSPAIIGESEVDMVMETLYALEDPAILGYGLVPFEPGLMLLPEDARAARRTIWLDGTNGGLMALNGSANTAYTAEEGTTFTLPEQWQSPAKYSYVLRGWYDVVNNKYYEPGAEVVVEGNMVFYADWAAATYDIGRFNSQTVDTVSTNDFVTVRMFDYGVLFNVLSERASVSYGNNSHTETWELLTNGKNPYNQQNTLNYIFRDWDQGGDISYPNGTNNPNNPTDAGSVYPGLYTSQIGSLLFDPNTQVIGKQYLGTGDYLFQLCLDPNHEHYGYYYYNSERNAASYNQSQQRFYVYDYLECTRTSYNNSSEASSGKYSDFLPLNSPYANTNGKTINTYAYAGVEGEYNGTTHYMYDCRYNDNNNSPNYVGTNFFFGMSVNVDFYLPNAPGSGNNQDIYGNDMHFRFSGDDDVWIFVDGKMVLDLGGLHGMETGDINFSSGQVTVNGVVDNALSNTLRSITAGEHVLTLYYLERGSSMSNCAIYFNLAPRFSFSIQKEDILTRDVLNGAQFSVFTDKACTVPAELWTSKASHDRGDPATNTFTVTDGIAHMWGMGASNIYYIKEIKPPDDPDYGFANGIIELTFDKMGTASYNVEILDGGGGISNGFTVHGFRIDTETQMAYIVATNAPKWVKETTEVHARKLWEDNLSHSGDAITVYLTTTDPDGTVRRLQEVELSNANDWYHMWENLPKYREDGVTPIVYGVEEGYISGYYSKVEQVEDYTTVTSRWEAVNSFQNGKTYILGYSGKYLSTLNNASDTGFMWVDQQTAQNSPLALWKVTISGQNVTFTNGANQTITFYYNGGSSGYPTDFFASTAGENDASKQKFRYTTANNGIRIYYDGADGRDYYMASGMTDAKKFQYNTNASGGMLFTPMTKNESTTTQTVTGWAYLITNSTLERETSLTVHKYWDYGHVAQSNLHEQSQVTVRLMADGRFTGRTVTLNLKNGWKETFRGLPYEDENGRVISYTVEESWDNSDWIPSYGEIVISNGTTPTYTASITNRYRQGMGGPELPSTGSAARMLYTLCGSTMMLTSLVYGILLRRKRERRMK